MNKILISIVGLVVVVLGVWLWSDKNVAKNNPADNSANVKNETMENKEATKIFKIEASNFKYSVSEMQVKKGDKVKIILSIREGFHDLVLDEFGVAIEKMQAGKTAEVEFIADKEGKFEYYCSVGTHRQMGMVGTLIVQ